MIVLHEDSLPYIFTVSSQTCSADMKGVIFLQTKFESFNILISLQNKSWKPSNMIISDLFNQLFC